jgi:hypothetical protein
MKVFKHLVSANKGVSLLLLACFMAQPVLSTEKQDDAQINTKKRLRFTKENLGHWQKQMKKGSNPGKMFEKTVKFLARESLVDNDARYLWGSHNTIKIDPNKYLILNICKHFSKLLVDTYGKEEARGRFSAFFSSLETLQKYREDHPKAGLMGEAESDKSKTLTKDTLDELRKIEEVHAASSYLTNLSRSKYKGDKVEKKDKSGRNSLAEHQYFLRFQKDQKDLSEELLGLIEKQTPLGKSRTYDAEKHKESCKKYYANQACLKINFLEELKEILTKNLSVISKFELDHGANIIKSLGIKEHLNIALGIKEHLNIKDFLKQFESHITTFEQRKDKKSYAESIYNEMKQSSDQMYKDSILKEQRIISKYLKYINFEESNKIIELINRVPLLNVLLAANRSVMNGSRIRTGKNQAEFEKFTKFLSSRTGISEMTKKEQDAVKTTSILPSFENFIDSVSRRTKIKEEQDAVKATSILPSFEIERKRDLKATKKQDTGNQKPSIAVAPNSQLPDGQAIFEMLYLKTIFEDDLPNLNKKQKRPNL